MPIDPKLAEGQSLGVTESVYGPMDVILYHLGIGAGAAATDAKELEYTYEGNLKVLPSFATVAAQANVVASEDQFAFNDLPGLKFDFAMLLHGEEEIILHQPLPTQARIRTETRIGDIYDKGKAALVVMEGETKDESGTPLYTTRSSMFIRGEGGFGGKETPEASKPRPDREPDGVVERPTLPQQALLYRLTGDTNPLHADPAFAAQAGFDAPIIHGMCSYGVACKAIVDEALGGDVARVARYSARFSGIFFPGETYQIAYWIEGDKIYIESSCKERQAPVISNAVITVR